MPFGGGPACPACGTGWSSSWTWPAAGHYRLVEVDPRTGKLAITRWVDTSGEQAPVRIGQFNALSDKEIHAYEAGVW